MNEEHRRLNVLLNYCLEFTSGLHELRQFLGKESSKLVTM